MLETREAGHAVPLICGVVIGLNSLEPYAHTDQVASPSKLNIVRIGEEVSDDVLDLLSAEGAADGQASDVAQTGGADGELSDRPALSEGETGCISKGRPIEVPLGSGIAKAGVVQRGRRENMGFLQAEDLSAEDAGELC